MHPSWLISLALHGLLLFVVASGLKSCEGELTGGPEAGMREVGLHVKQANALLDRADDEADNAVPFEQPLDSAVPLIEERPPADLQTPRFEQPADLIGPGSAPPSSAAQIRVEGTIKANGALQGPRVGGLDKGETSFFGVRDNATQFAYLLDASGSMAGVAILAAKAELKRSIEALDATQRFQIIFYSDTPRVMKIRGAADDSLVWATGINKTLAAQDVNNVGTAGGTDHMPALKKALRLNPEVLYFLTDADFPILTAADLNEIKQLNKGRTRIHCIEFGNGPDLGIENFLVRLARQNGGTYLYRDVKQLERKR